MNYEQDIKIDEDALDVECLEQSRLMLRYTKHQAHCQAEEEDAKEALDLKKAELDLAIRSDPEAFNIAKITESVVNSTILSEGGFQKASKEYQEARFENNVAKGAVRAMESRKHMLEGLIRLHAQQYFAGPKVPRNLSEEYQRKQQAADSKVKMKRRNKPA